MSTEKKELKTKKRFARKLTRRQFLKGMAPRGLTEETKVGKAVSGTIKYPWGTVPRATVTLADKSVVSDATGKFEIAGLTPGVYTLLAKAPFPGYEMQPQTVEVSKDEAKVVEVFLEFEKTILEGHVYDQDKKPITGAVVSGVLSGKDMETATTDEQGHFRFDKAKPGHQFIRVNAKGFMGEVRDLETRKGEITTADFQMTSASYKLYGTVTDHLGKALRAEILIRDQKSDIIIEKTSSDDKTGYYEVYVLPGVYGVLATAPDFTSDGWLGEVSADVKADIKLLPAHAIRPRVDIKPEESMPVLPPWGQ